MSLSTPDAPRVRYAIADTHEATAQAGLRRMRTIATGLLLAMLGLLATSAALQATHPWLHWLRAFAEAGAIGAMADWYAVVALFRRPLGLPIPHTAIIPANKDRIGESLGQFVEQNFLTPENIVAKLEQHDTAKILARWLSYPGNSRVVAESIGEFIPGILNALTDDDAQRFFERTVLPPLLHLDAAKVAGKVIQILTAGGRHQALLDEGLAKLEAWANANRDLIKTKFGEASRFTPPVFDSYIVDRFVDGIVALLREVAGNPEHELRQRFDHAVGDLAHQLQTSEDYRERGKNLMREIAVHLRQEPYYRELWNDISGWLRADITRDSSLIREAIAGALVTLGQGLLDEPTLQRKLNAWWLETVEKTVVRQRHHISLLITEVVRSWDAEDVSRKIEMEIGKDLQYIRINGTLVGGTVGIALHALTRVVAI